MAEQDQLYLIGEVSELCGVSRRTLRYYEDLELIEPDYIANNNYRYYSHETMLRIPVISYLKMMNFELREISEIVQGQSYAEIIKRFDHALNECTKEATELQERYQIIDDWKNLVEEAAFVIRLAQDPPCGVRYLQRAKLLKMPYRFEYKYAEAIINLKFTAFVAENNNKISGPVTILFPSHKKKLEEEKNKKTQEALVIQKALRPITEKNTYIRPEGLYAACYHIGPHKTLARTYKKIYTWAEKNSYQLEEISYERYVTDQWSTPNAEMHVTEVLIPIEQKGGEK